MVEIVSGVNMNEEQIKKAVERKALIRGFADKYRKGEINYGNNLEQKIISALDSATLPPVQLIEIEQKGVSGIWKKIQKKYLNFMWGWYFNRIFFRQTRYNKELIDIIRIFNKRIDEQRRIIDNLEKTKWYC